MWYAVGYALSFGKGNGFIGTTVRLVWPSLCLFGSRTSAAECLHPKCLADYAAVIFLQNFFLSRTPIPSKEFTFWLFTNAFAATASTIVSGALAERCRFEAYLVYTICISGAAASADITCADDCCLVPRPSWC